MTAPRIQKFVTTCGGCPHRIYNSGGQYLCDQVGQPVQKEGRIPSFCPLPIFPAAQMAGLEATVRAMQGSIHHGFGPTLFAYIAARVKQPLHASGMALTIPYFDAPGREEKAVTLDWNYILEVIVNRGFSVEFMCNDRKYILFPDLDPPQLKVQEISDLPELKDRELFSHHDVDLDV